MTRTSKTIFFDSFSGSQTISSSRSLPCEELGSRKSRTLGSGKVHVFEVLLPVSAFDVAAAHARLDQTDPLAQNDRVVSRIELIRVKKGSKQQQ
jgi:hypothetical protein